MIFRGITATNDWAFGKGVNSYFTKQDALVANIRTTLMFFLNDCFFAMNFGLDWWNLLGAKNPAAKTNILLQTRAALVQCEGVVRINSVDVRVDAVKRKLTLLFNIDTIYSRSVTGAVQIP